MSTSNPSLPLSGRRGHRTSTADPAPFALRLRTWCDRGRLDRFLARGVSPSESAELALRATQLTRETSRLRLAAAIEGVVRSAERGCSPRAARPPIRLRAVMGARTTLLALAGELRRRTQPSPRGVALVQRLLVDGDGPLHLDGDPDALWQTAYRALAELTGESTA